MLTTTDFNFSKREVIKMIRRECSKQGITQKEQIDYILATAEHETNGTFMPVVEAYWMSENWRKRNLRYYPYHGRGLVQITWPENYKKFGKLLSVDLHKHPDKALDIKHAVFILVYGFKHGVFTGKKLSDYINNSKIDYLGARRIINGKDKRKRIAKLARKYNKHKDIA